MKSIYVIGELWKTRWIIRNQWHKDTCSGFKLVELGRSRFRDRKEFLFTLFGFQLTLFINE